MRSCRAFDLRLGTGPVGTGAVGAGGPSDAAAPPTRRRVGHGEWEGLQHELGHEPTRQGGLVRSDGKGHWKPMKYSNASRGCCRATLIAPFGQSQRGGAYSLKVHLENR